MGQSTTTISTRWTVASLLSALALMLAMALAMATPTQAQAQAGADQYDPAGSPSESFATLSFELTVECEPPANAAFFGNTPAESLLPVQLTDPDGDGLYTGSTTLYKYPQSPWLGQPPEPVSIPAQIVQGPPTEHTVVGPEYQVIKDFGLVKLDGDKTLAATISFCDGGSDSDQYSSGDQYAPVSGGTVSSPSSGDGTGLAQLPSTGGAMLLTVGAGALLVGSGLLIRKIF